jgi:2-methylcitrate dehydratase PrpD
LRRDEAHVCVIDAGRARHDAHVDHAAGTVDNPMPDEAIRQKFLANAEPAVGPERAREIAERVWSLEALDDVRDLLRLCA